MTTVAMFLCPNRNLTTLTAATLSLHPHVQVMNHGFERLDAVGALRFLQTGNGKELDNFIACATEMSRDGQRGDFGGSILHSHAFSRPALQNAYSSRYGETRLKKEIHCLLWKDGAQLLEFVKRNNIDPVQLTEQLPRLRFISPMRHPLAHIKSLKRYYGLGLPAYIQPTLYDLSTLSLAEYILSAHNQFLAWEQRRQSQFFHFHQTDLHPTTLNRMAQFLGIVADSEWLQAAAALFINDAVVDKVEADSVDETLVKTLLAAKYASAFELQKWYAAVTLVDQNQEA